MLAAAILSVLAMTLIVAVRYLAASGFFAWLTDRRLPGLYDDRQPQIRREIGWSLASAFIYGAPAGLLAWGWQERGWTRIYSSPDAYPLAWIPASILVYLLLHDTWFYWTHRLMHRPKIYKRMHAVHHASRNPTAWTAMSFHPWESVTGAVLVPALVLLIPIHCAALLTVLRQLPQRQREVIAYRVFLDLDTLATAKALGIAPGTVTAHLSRAVATLRGHLVTADTPEVGQ